MNKVVCVLKSGGPFTADHVYALYRNLVRSLAVPFEMHALADVPVTCDVFHSLDHNLPSWWSKMELFRLGLFEDRDRVVYMDLDTVLVGNVDWLFDFRGSFVMLKAFRHDRWASGLMAWEGQPPPLLWREFMATPRVHMGMNRRGGDQRFLMRCMKDNKMKPAFWQDQFPHQVVSYKRHVALMMQPPKDSVVCFHGQPRPWDVSGVKWIMEARA